MDPVISDAYFSPFRKIHAAAENFIGRRVQPRRKIPRYPAGGDISIGMGHRVKNSLADPAITVGFSFFPGNLHDGYFDVQYPHGYIVPCFKIHLIKAEKVLCPESGGHCNRAPETASFVFYPGNRKEAG
ncbi:MAG: hypothetical protein ACLTZ2_05525 [Desulfovibrio sp.]